MNILAIDIGTYSVKFIEFQMERRALSIVEASEVPLNEIAKQFDPLTTIEQLQAEVIQSYLEDGFDGKIIYQVPNKFVTSRFLTLPVVNKRKVEMMIPFQLDENLPYPTSEAHFITTLKKTNNETQVLVNITKSKDFEEIFDLFDQKHILPNIWTSELSIIDSYCSNRKASAPYAILDVGHTTSKCYIIQDGQVISNHLSYTAGKNLDEVISQTYQISDSEAVIYKHDNCFFLTDNQYEQVTDEQKEFATLMKQAIWPLVQDVRRWLLGFRVKSGLSVEQIYIIGGTANINNFANFLSQSIEVKATHLSPSDSIIDKEDLLDGAESNFILSSIIGLTNTFKEKPANFLQGQFSKGAGLSLPLHSTSFIFSRVMIVCMFISTLLLVERFAFSQKEIKSLDRKIVALMKNPKLGINANDRKRFSKRPDRVLKSLKRKEKSISQEIKTIMSSNQVNALEPLAKISQEVGTIGTTYITNYISKESVITITYMADNPNDLEKLHEKVKSTSFSNSKISYQKGSKRMTMIVEDM